jgi:hypothetical protein
VVLAPIFDGPRRRLLRLPAFLGGPHRVLYYWHSVGNHWLTRYSNMLTNFNLTDMETCYKAIRGELARALLPKLTADRFGFEPEITARLAKADARIYEVPISYSAVRTRKERKLAGRTASPPCGISRSSTSSADSGVSRSLRRPAWPLPAISLALLAIAASATGIVNGFTYDDRPVILENPFMRDLHGWWRAFTTPYWPPDWGSDGYRPLTSLAFKLEFALSGGNAMVIHGANIALYALSAVLAYYLARRVLPGWCAWVVAALFAVHPVHVEAVANGVGQSELLVAVFMIPAVTLYLRDRMRGDGVLAPRTIAAILLLYAGACFSKEHGVVLPALLVAAELTVIADATPVRERARRLRPVFLALTGVALVFLAARSRSSWGGKSPGFSRSSPSLRSTSHRPIAF